jgi:hypothetical protein
MSNNYLVNLLVANRGNLSPDFNKHLDFIIQKIKSSPEKITNIQTIKDMGSINIGTPDQPINVPIQNLDPLLTYLQENFFTSSTNDRVVSYVKILNNKDFNYGQPKITQKEKDYINRFVKKLNVEKIGTNKLASFPHFLDNIVIPFINQVRIKCSDLSAKMDPLIPFDQCDIKTQTDINALIKKIEKENQGNSFFMVQPENSLNIPIKQENTFVETQNNQSFEGAQNIFDFVSRELSNKAKNETEGNISSNSVEKFLRENDPTVAYDKSKTVDMNVPQALGAGDPYFENQVSKDATYFSSNYKNMTKKTQVVIADVYNGTSGTYPYAITDHKVEFSENLIVTSESDVQLEFMNLHEIHGNSTVATRKSLEHYHGFILKISELSKYFNSISNMGNLTGTYYIPNDTFGFQDNNEPNIIDSGVISAVGVTGTTKTIITLPDNSLHSSRDDYYNSYYLKITSGTGEGQIEQIEDYAGATRIATLKTLFDPQPSAGDTFEILESPHSNRTLNSMVFKLKNSFMCTMKPEKIQSFTITLSGLEHGTTSPVPLYIGNSDGRFQVGIHIKER